jgi:MoxR-like ATPase
MAAAKAAPRTRPKSRARTKVSVTPDDIQGIIDWLDQKVLVERQRELPVLARGTLAGVNIHQEGGGGLAKSLGLREFSKCIVGARYFGIQLMPTTPPDAVIGPYDMQRMVNEGVFERAVDGYAPTSHIVFIDELMRGSGPIRDALMPMLNAEERMAQANGGMFVTPILVMVTASNTGFDPDDAYSQAIEDRITLMQRVEDIKADDSFKELLRRHHARRIGEQDGSFEATRKTITVEQLIEAQHQVERVELMAEFLDAAAELRRKTKGEGLSVSPRRWMELCRVCRANAWMSGRDHLIPEDLVVVEDGLWRQAEHIPIARKLVQEYRGKFERMAEDRRAESDKAFARIDAIRPQVEGTPPGEDMPQEVLLEGVNAMRDVAFLKKRVLANVDEAEREKRAATDLHALVNEIATLEDWAAKHGMPVHQL